MHVVLRGNLPGGDGLDELRAVRCRDVAGFDRRVVVEQLLGVRGGVLFVTERVGVRDLCGGQVPVELVGLGMRDVRPWDVRGLLGRDIVLDLRLRLVGVLREQLVRCLRGRVLRRFGGGRVFCVCGRQVL